MRIGIVTQPLWGNYGGILQNYALQQVLKNLGHDPITLDMMTGASGLRYIYIAVRHFVAYLLGKRTRCIAPYAPIRKQLEVVDFVSHYISLTEPFWNRYPRNIVDKYALEGIIAGSDQVWRPQYNVSLEDMFLEFCRGKNLKRVSYGASFGCAEWEYTESQRKKCSKLLSNFNSVSVREMSALELLKKLGCNSGRQVVDPTILLGRDGFDKIINNNNSMNRPERYLGSYILDDSKKTSEILHCLAKETGLDNVVVFHENTPGFGPIEWIEMIRNASYFITDSFHGTVFCLLYHVPFVTVINKARGADRFISLLEPLGLDYRLVDTIHSARHLKDEIDWVKVDGVFEKQRKESINFLDSSFS